MAEPKYLFCSTGVAWLRGLPVCSFHRRVSRRLALNSLVDRVPSAPEDVVLHLSFGRAIGTFKLSSFNAAGESALSQGTIVY